MPMIDVYAVSGERSTTARPSCATSRRRHALEASRRFLFKDNTGSLYPRALLADAIPDVSSDGRDIRVQVLTPAVVATGRSNSVRSRSAPKIVVAAAGDPEPSPLDVGADHRLPDGGRELAATRTLAPTSPDLARRALERWLGLGLASLPHRLFDGGDDALDGRNRHVLDVSVDGNGMCGVATRSGGLFEVVEALLGNDFDTSPAPHPHRRLLDCGHPARRSNARRYRLRVEWDEGTAEA